MKIIFNTNYIKDKSDILDLVNDFDRSGIELGNQKRNTIKLFNIGKRKINIKSFKSPNFINSLIYDTFRKSKAQRSYEYANKLINLDVLTPLPIAYIQNSSFIRLKQSYYISEHLDYDFTFREISRDLSFNDSVNALKAFTRFTYNLHEKGIHFLDHSPGNTLIKKDRSGYDFYLVDLNRMEFKQMTLLDRIKNFSRLSHSEDVVKIMSCEYAKCIGESDNYIYDLMWKEIMIFRSIVNRKRKLKSILKAS